MNDHVSHDIIERYVMGDVDPLAAAAINRHVESCPPCAAMLQREAQVDEAMHTLMDDLRQHPIVRQQPRARHRAFATGALAAGLAMAAAVTLVLAETPAIALKAAPEVQKCASVTRANDCMSRAEFDGLISMGPDRSLRIPRYDQTLHVSTPGEQP